MKKIESSKLLPFLFCWILCGCAIGRSSASILEKELLLGVAPEGPNFFWLYFHSHFLRSSLLPPATVIGWLITDALVADENYYQKLFTSSSATVKCKDGSTNFNKSRLNDDFCDCPDASDEPGYYTFFIIFLLLYFFCFVILPLEW